jgi:hypothetical protein
VVDGILARWNTSGLAPGLYSVRLGMIVSFAGIQNDTLTTGNTFDLVVNAPPVIANSSPAGDTVNAAAGSHLRFSVNASDPEGSRLSYRWIMHDTVVSADTSCEITAAAIPSDSVTVVIGDEYHEISRTWFLKDGNTSNVTGDGTAPRATVLHQNYPNPFNPTTTVRFEIRDPRFVSLRIYDVLGREVATLVNGKKDAGAYSLEWNAADCPGGIYFCRLVAGTTTQTRKILLLR